jgi:hypothetical protein
MDRPLRILCLSFWTPPIVRPQAILIGKMIPEWMRQGAQPVIVTYDTCGTWNIDAPVYQIPQYQPLRFPFSRIPFLNDLREYLRYQKTSHFVSTLVKKHHIDVLFSFASPQDSNIVGALVKKQTGVPFISHFSDPWVDSPLKTYHGLSKIRASRLETLVITASDLVITVNSQLKALIAKKYAATEQDKFRVIPHCYCPSDYDPIIEQTPHSKAVLSHIGVFYKKRTPETFFKALAALFAEEPDLASRVTVKLVGGSDRYTDFDAASLEALVSTYRLNSIVEVTPAVSYRDSLREMRHADFLLFIDSEYPFFLPSKIVDYAGSGKPIVGITPPGSVSSELLNGLGYPSFSHADTSQLKDFLRSCLTGEKRLKLNTNYLQQYDVASTTKQLLELCTSIATPDHV